MKEPTTDPERLAALLDGRLDERERAEVLARLAASDEELSLFADATAVIREMETGAPRGAEPGVAATGPRHRHWFRGPWLALAAAVVVAAAIVPWMWMRSRTNDSDDPGRFAARLASRGEASPSDWSSRPWRTYRGGSEPRAIDACSVRLGVYLTDLTLAVRSRDTSSAGLSREIVSLLPCAPTLELLAGQYRDIERQAGAPPERLEPALREARMATARLAGQDLVALGAWAEAARIAAGRRDTAFFRDRATRAELDRAAAMARLPEGARPIVEWLRAMIAAGAPLDWSAVERELTELVRVMAG